MPETITPGTGPGARGWELVLAGFGLAFTALLLYVCADLATDGALTRLVSRPGVPGGGLRPAGGTRGRTRSEDARGPAA